MDSGLQSAHFICGQPVCLKNSTDGAEAETGGSLWIQGQPRLCVRVSIIIKKKLYKQTKQLQEGSSFLFFYL